MHLTTQWVILKLSWNPWFGLLLASPDCSFSFITLHVLSNKETKIKMNLSTSALENGFSGVSSSWGLNTCNILTSGWWWWDRQLRVWPLNYCTNLGSCFLYVGPCVNQQSITVLANSHQVVSQELTHQIDE